MFRPSRLDSILPVECVPFERLHFLSAHTLEGYTLPRCIYFLNVYVVEGYKIFSTHVLFDCTYL